MAARRAAGFAISVASHVLLAMWLSWAPPLRLGNGPAPPMAVVLLPPIEDDQFKGLKPLGPDNGRWHFDQRSVEGQIATADLERIGSHMRVLFPFVTPGLSIDAFIPGVSPSRLTFINPYGRPRDPKREEPKPGGPLRLSLAAMNALVDRTWARGERWKAFQPIRALLDAHDANDPALAELVQLYCERNALQPYADGSIRDLRLWAQLGLAADHVTFIGYIRDYVRAHPSTRVATNLLFLLDELAEANEDALAVLVETDHPEDLQWTRQANARAYLLVRRIQREYAHEIVRRGLFSRARVNAFYDAARLDILDAIIRTSPGGYRANDARFLIGSIYWKQRRRYEALGSWRTLTAAIRDSYAVPISQIRTALDTGAASDRNIAYILANDQGRWLAFSDARLRRFGYRFDTF